MLGEKVLEHTGRVTSQRVLSTNGGAGPTMETSVQAQEKVLGIEASTTITYTAVARPDGTLFGNGEGIVMTAEGDLATWIGQGVGTMGEGGTASWRGAIFYQTASPKLARLNNVAVVFEYEIDANGNTTGSGWEWK